MKSKSPILFFLIFVLTTGWASAQESRFIEVAAADTIELKPMKFQYQISIQASPSYNMNMLNDRTANVDSSSINLHKHRESGAVSFRQILDLLEKNQFHYSISNESNYAIGSFKLGSDSAISVTLESEADVKKLYTLLISQQNISSHISDIEYEPAYIYQDGQFERLFTKAKRDAEKIAAISGSSLGQLISVTEDRNMLTDMIDEIRNAEFTSVFQNVGIMKNNFRKKLLKKMLFRFEIK